jgi:dihydrofolate synthase/folylpolyglutamate synthase
MSEAPASQEAYRRAIEFLYGLRLFGANFGLENTFKLAALAGNPQNKLRFIHVAGTNGKGSTCAMLESIYRAAGLRVGLFTSPHLVSFRERIQVNRELISEVDVVRLVAELRGLPLERRSPDRLEPAATFYQRADREIGAPMAARDACPTFFEFVTMMALKYFAEQKCDLVIWETGLGGRLDATNIVTPLASVITNIGLDHQQWLGETLEKIAAEKAGIIKPGVPVITATEKSEALRVIEEIAGAKNAPLVKVGQASRLSPSKKTKKSETGATPVLPLPGEHQRLNAALALATVEVLQNKIPVGEKQVRDGLEKVNWPGRMQLITTPSGQKILLDGAHNPDGAEALCAALKAGFPESKPTIILGVFRDKDSASMCHSLAPLAGRIVLTPVHSERTEDPARLASACREANSQVVTEVCASLAEALEKTAGEPFVVVAGSLYLVGEAMELLQLSPAPDSDEKSLNEWSLSNPRGKQGKIEHAG